jgi:hypothetical protein
MRLVVWSLSKTRTMKERRKRETTKPQTPWTSSTDLLVITDLEDDGKEDGVEVFEEF